MSRRTSRFRGRSVVWLVLGLALLPVAAEEGETPAPATSEGSDDSALTEYVEVNTSSIPQSNTIATKFPLPLHLTPANVGVVSRSLMEEQEAFVLGDALRNVSGLNVQSNGGVHDFFLIRGFDSLSGSLVLTDGAVEPEATFYPLYNVEGVEVLKGPGGFLYGNDPLAGVVNIIRKQPLPTPLLGVSLTAGSFGTAQTTVDWNLADADGSLAFRLNGMLRDSDRYRDVDGLRHTAINPGFAWRFGEHGRLNVNLEYVDAEFAPDAGIPIYNGEIADVPRRRSYQTPFDDSDQQLGRFQVDWENRVGQVRLRNKLYYRDLDWKTRGTQFIGVFPNFMTGAPEVSRVLTGLDDRQKLWGNQFEAAMSFGAGVRHDVVAGLEIKTYRDDFAIDIVTPEDPFNPGLPGIPNIDLFNPVETATAVTPFPYLDGASDSRVLAPYVMDQIRFSDRFQLMLGARYDVIERDDERLDFSTGVPTPADISRDDSKLSPMAGLVFAPRPDLTLYANASESFSPAGVRVLEDLDPEESRGYELGAKKNFLDGRVRTTVALFRIDRQNVAIPDDNGITQQAGDQRSQGLELEFAAEPRKGLRAFASYAYTDAELTRFSERVIVGFDPMTGQPIEATVDRSGNSPAFVPKHLLNLWVSRSFAGGLGVGLGARWFSDQYLAEDNAFQIDGALVFDATVFYDFKQWRLNLNLKNLTDEEYERRGFGSTSVIPADPFAVYAGVQLRM